AYTWKINGGAIGAMISSGPSKATTERSATFNFSGSGATGFQCSLDGADFAPCTSPQNYSGLSRGDHTFRVRALNGDTVGVIASYSWTINNTAPIATNQSLTTLQATAITITLSASDDDPLTYAVVDQPTGGKIAGTPPLLIYTPDADFSGTDNLTFVAN